MATQITNKAELKSIATTLHDARFTADAMVFDASARTFTLKCWVFDSASQRWQGRRLSLGGVIDCKVNVKEKVSYYELATILFSERDGKLDLVAHYGIESGLAVSRLDGALTETGETREKWE